VELVEELFEKYECRWQCLDPTRNDVVRVCRRGNKVKWLVVELASEFERPSKSINGCGADGREP
jgi:hypothetical protein